MAAIKNPNDIVEEFVADYRGVLGDELLSVILYGSAATHEYRPGASDINIALVVADNGIARISRCVSLHGKWARRRVATPYFMTREYIERSLDTYPIEFFDMRNNYRVLYGEDALGGLDIKLEHLRLQCERELKGAALHLRTGYVQSRGRARELQQLLTASVRRLLPVFKALLVLAERAVPKTKSEIISAVEERYNLGVAVLSEIYRAGGGKVKREYETVFDEYVRVVDRLVQAVDTMTHEGS